MLATNIVLFEADGFVYIRPTSQDDTVMAEVILEAEEALTLARKLNMLGDIALARPPVPL